MKITVNTNSNENFKIEQGVYPACIVGIYDLGTQETKLWGTKKQVVFLFELNNDLDKKEERLYISKTYTQSFGENSNLRKDIQNMFSYIFKEGEEVELFEYAGLCGQASIVEKDNFSNIGALMPLPRGNKGFEPKAIVATYSIEENKKAIPEKCPDWVKKKIQESPEFKALK